MTTAILITLGLTLVWIGSMLNYTNFHLKRIADAIEGNDTCSTLSSSQHSLYRPGQFPSSSPVPLPKA